MSIDVPNKSLGQHWLHDQTVLEDIVGSADITADDVVLEIGPGLGTLTAVLVGQAKRVVAVEFDHTLAVYLLTRVKADNLQIVESDILKFDLTTLPAHYKVVANIPYYLTSNLIRVLSETSNPPQTAVLLIQKEVAERAAARAGDMSMLAVTAQYFWDITLGNIVPAELFTPPPKVDSQILILERRAQPLFGDIDTALFFRLIKAGFSQRRKTLLNSLSGGLSLDKASVKSMCEQAGIDAGRRAQTLTLQEWHKLYLVIPTAAEGPRT
jgi:16S rRNA (adenine1518-N6/adenine1519-N6)-dimethyltransferase